MTKDNRSLTIRNARVIGDNSVIDGGFVAVEEGLISRVGGGPPPEGLPRPEIDAGGLYVGPGFIDLHCHGAAGVNFLDADLGELRDAVATHARHGTTGLLATIGTAPLKLLERGMVRLSNLVAEGSCDGLLGIHLEGPYLNRLRCGAQPSGEIRPPERTEILNLLDFAGGALKIMTFAPEVGGGYEVITLLEERGVIPAIGHSDATAQDARRAFAAGARYVTHLFNAMNGLHHRNPGLAAAALMDESVPVEIIADGVHVAPLMVRMTLALKGLDGIIIVTDCMEALDTDSGEFRMGGRRVSVRDGVPVTEDGVLCGTTLTMSRAVNNFRKYTGITVREAIRPGTINPARVLGIEGRKGSLAAGKDADLAVFDDEMKVKATVIGGRIVHNSIG